MRTNLIHSWGKPKIVRVREWERVKESRMRRQKWVGEWERSESCMLCAGNLRSPCLESSVRSTSSSSKKKSWTWMGAYILHSLVHCRMVIFIMVKTPHKSFNEKRNKKKHILPFILSPVSSTLDTNLVRQKKLECQLALTWHFSLSPYDRVWGVSQIWATFFTCSLFSIEHLGNVSRAHRQREKRRCSVFLTDALNSREVEKRHTHKKNSSRHR